MPWAFFGSDWVQFPKWKSLNRGFSVHHSRHVFPFTNDVINSEQVPNFPFNKAAWCWPFVVLPKRRCSQARKLSIMYCANTGLFGSWRLREKGLNHNMCGVQCVSQTWLDWEDKTILAKRRETGQDNQIVTFGADWHKLTWLGHNQCKGKHHGVKRERGETSKAE